MMKSNITAGIVLYNSDIDRLCENINAVKNQVDQIIFFDNNSKNIDSIENLILSQNIKYHILKSTNNNGIAFALNEIAKYAIDQGYEWLLTLDDDSVVYPDLIAQYSKYLLKESVGQLSCLLKDRNIKSQKIENKDKWSIKEQKYAITSASLIKLSALAEAGGFNTDLFIDWVDNEICCALRRVGYKTFQVNYVGLLQEMGSIKSHKLFKKVFYTPNYNSIRYYYNARNSIFVSRLYPSEEKTKKIIVNQLKMMIQIILFESDKYSKVKAITKGIKDGLTKKEKRERYL